MFKSANSARIPRRFSCAFMAVAFLTGEVHAQGATMPAGTMAMLRMRIPFGGATTPLSQSTLGLSFGSSWRDVPGSTSLTGGRFVPTVEAGVSFRGDPVLRLGTFDISSTRANLEAAQGEGRTFCGRNLALCIIGGAAIIGGVGYFLYCEVGDRRDPTCGF